MKDSCTWTDQRESQNSTARGLDAAPVHIHLLFSAGQLHHDCRVVPDEVIVGREVEGHNSLCLTLDSLASRKHARIYRQLDRVYVSDLCSKNGIYVNGQLLQSGVLPLANGDLIRIGQSLLLVKIAEFGLARTSADTNKIQASLRGDSAVMHHLRERCSLAAASRDAVLLLGGTGTGKELAAQAIHQLSQRTGPFVSVNAALLQDSLAESMLFGHVKGSFTGASSAQSGFFQQADGGTLFLDEIGDLPLRLQPKLLRALETLMIRPIGAQRDVAVDVRVIAATHVNLSLAVDSAHFRADLYERLAVLPIELPPLSARREDILELFFYFLNQASSRPAPPLKLDLAELLLRYRWPHNVRELRNFCRRLIAFAPNTKKLGIGEIPYDLVAPLLQDITVPSSAVSTSGVPSAGQGVPTRPLSSTMILEALAKHGGVISRAAAELGIHRLALFRLMKKLEIERPESDMSRGEQEEHKD